MRVRRSPIGAVTTSIDASGNTLVQRPTLVGGAAHSDVDRMAQGETVMDLVAEQVEVWAASIPDTAGGLAGILTTLRDVGADLQLIIARRSPDRPGEGVAFVTPIQGDREMVAAAMLGFNVTQKLHCVRVLGRNQRGVAAALVEELTEAGINLRGFSAAVIGPQFVAYVAVDSQAEADHATAVLQAL